MSDIRELLEPEQLLNLEYIKACIRVAANARMFADSTDDSPLTGLSWEQGYLWDGLCDSLSILDELESAT